jgi:hypothetical protein
MTKQTKMWLGIGAVALVGYYIWKQSQKPKGDGEKKNAMGMTNTYSKPYVIKALNN